MPAVITLLSDIMGGTVKIFKKCSPNGRVYLYLGNREFVSCDGAIPPVTGIVNIQDHHDTLKELCTIYDVLDHVEAKKDKRKVWKKTPSPPPTLFINILLTHYIPTFSALLTKS